MKNHGTNLLLALTVLFVGITIGFSLGRNSSHQPVQLSVIQRASLTATTEKSNVASTVTPASGTQVTSMSSADLSAESTVSTTPPAQETSAVSSGPVNVNTADLAALMDLPGIGEVLAQRIIDYRKAHGAFQHPEELTNVSGIGEKRLAAILDYITVGG